MAESFGLSLAKWCDRAGAQADLVVQTVALEMFTRVILKSPVDTGRFRANWQFSLGSPSSVVTETVDKDGGATTARVATGVLSGRAGQVFYLTNNLPYARRLEYGWSKQAPAGMVRTTVEEFRAVVEAAAGQGATA